jgi:hypothetical protein
MLVAVRAIAPVAEMPPKRPAAMLAMPCATSLQIRAEAAAGHAVGDCRRQKRLDASEKGDGESVGEEGADVGEVDGRDMRQVRAGLRDGLPTTRPPCASAAAKASASLAHISQ